VVSLKSFLPNEPMAAGVTDRLSEIADIAKLVEDAEAAPKKRGPYKKSIWE
jgi:hypothetical protein